MVHAVCTVIPAWIQPVIVFIEITEIAIVTEVVVTTEILIVSAMG